MNHAPRKTDYAFVSIAASNFWFANEVLAPDAMVVKNIVDSMFWLDSVYGLQVSMFVFAVRLGGSLDWVAISSFVIGY